MLLSFNDRRGVGQLPVGEVCLGGPSNNYEDNHAQVQQCENIVEPKIESVYCTL